MKKRNKRTRLRKSAYFQMYVHPAKGYIDYTEQCRHLEQYITAHGKPDFVELSYEDLLTIAGF